MASVVKTERLGGKGLLMHPLGCLLASVGSPSPPGSTQMAAAVLAWGQDEAGSLGHAQLPRECSRQWGRGKEYIVIRS